jgi:hypothetical protein
VQWLSLLQVQRDLLDVPPGTGRFQQYLATMLDTDGNLRFPLPAFNPMSKEHVADLLDELLAMQDEHIGQMAMEEAGEQLSDLGGSNSTQVGLVVADDAKGGWTNRWLFEAKHQFESRYEQKRGIITALLWSSEPADKLRIRQKVMAAIYRHAWIRRHGHAKTLGAMLQQEGMAGCFAGLRMDALSAELEAVIRDHLETTHYPAIIACLYGDAAARACGYDPLGLPPDAGLSYGLALAYSLPDVVSQVS